MYIYVCKDKITVGCCVGHGKAHVTLTTCLGQRLVCHAKIDCLNDPVTGLRAPK